MIKPIYDLIDGSVIHIDLGGDQKRIYRCFIAKGFLNKFRGLMLRRLPLPWDGIMLIGCRDIHTFFMFFEIDLVFVDKDLRVIEVKRGVKPWRVIFAPRETAHLLEFPSNSNFRLPDHGARIGIEDTSMSALA